MAHDGDSQVGTVKPRALYPEADCLGACVQAQPRQLKL